MEKDTTPHPDNPSDQPPQDFLIPAYARYPIALKRGQGTRVWDTKGNEYLDFTSGIAVCALGHCHPAMVEALAAQSKRLWHCSNLFQQPLQAELARFLVEEAMTLPGKIFLCNSGAEANDGLIKAARRYGHQNPLTDSTPRTTILTLHQSFHGRTLGGIAATGQDKVKEGFDPMLPGFLHLPINDASAIEKAMHEHPVAAILLEPIQGEGGVRTATADFLRSLRTLCDKHRALLFFDEVQCGLGRTGHWCGWHSLGAEDVAPDGVSWAKGMGGGFPIGSFWLRDTTTREASPSLCDILGPGSHGTTYGGSPLACAVSLAVLREIRDKGLASHATKTGDHLMREIRSWNSPMIREVRGAGLLIGIELVADEIEVTDMPKAATPAMRVVHALLQGGLLVPPAGPDVIRLLPPLNVSHSECAAALNVLKATLAP